MHNFNEEQQHIYELAQQGYNVVVQAVAGTGKTTTVLGIAQKEPTKKILQVTYNKALRKDVQDSVKEQSIENVVIHTFHSLAKYYYLEYGYTDKEIRKMLLKQQKPRIAIQSFDMLVIDETQDMTLLYFQLLIKFLIDYNKPIQLLILGDKKQSLYEFKGSDERYLTRAEEIWSRLPYLKQPFKHTEMHMSYRITNQMASFVNNVLLGEQRMNACREGPKVEYVRYNQMNATNVLEYQITNALKNGLTPGDIFIIAASVKGKNPDIVRIENLLVNKLNLPCHIPNQESEQLDPRVSDNKITFATMHGVKGRGRKFVCLLGCDNSYFMFYNRNGDKYECPNTIYVGATRGSQQLILFENCDSETSRPMPFLHQSHKQMKNKEYMRFRGDEQLLPQLTKDQEKKLQRIPLRRVNVTDLTRFISEETLDILSPLLDSIYFKTELDLLPLDIPTVMESSQGMFEEVSDINGIALPAYYFDKFLNDEEALESQGDQLLFHIDTLLDDKSNKKQFFLQKRQDLPDTLTTIQDYLLACNLLVSIQEQLTFKLKQIDHYNWLQETMIEQCKKSFDVVLNDELSGHLTPEINIVEEDEEDVHDDINMAIKEKMSLSYRIKFKGRVDLVTERSVFELKCTTETTIEHFIQVAIYAWLWKMKHRGDPTEESREFKLYNMKQNELYTLKATQGQLFTIVIELLKAREEKPKKLSDDEFIERANCEIELQQMASQDLLVT
jgi:hypothetical protein